MLLLRGSLSRLTENIERHDRRREHLVPTCQMKAVCSARGMSKVPSNIEKGGGGSRWIKVDQASSIMEFNTEWNRIFNDTFFNGWFCQSPFNEQR